MKLRGLSGEFGAQIKAFHAVFEVYLQQVLPVELIQAARKAVLDALKLGDGKMEQKLNTDQA